MDFVNPALLFGALAAAAPVILHLVMRQQPLHLEFPALRFVQSRENANRRRMKLRHLILLLLRVAALCLLAAALARPSIKASGIIGDQEAPVAAALVFDTSPRMDYKSENKTRLEGAQEMGEWLLTQLPTESLVAVIDSTPAEPVFQVDLGAARQRISRLETTPAPQRLWDTLERAAELLKKGEPQRKDVPERKELYIFSDLAKAQWDSQAATKLRQRLAEMVGLGIYVIDVGVKEPQNFALGELRLGESITRNRPWSISTELMASGVGGQRAVEVYMLGEGGEEEMRAQETAEVAAGANHGIEFSLGPLDTGTHQGYVRLVGADGLAADDRRWFTVDVKPPWKVLVAAAPPVRARAFFFTEALAPDGLRQTGRARFECDVVPFNEMPQQTLDDYAVVCLLDPGEMGDDIWQTVDRFAQAGGGVGIFLGAAARPAALEKSDAAKALLPGVLGKSPAFFPDGDLYLTISNDQHPMAARFRALQGSIPWEAFPVYRYWPLRDLVKGAATVAAYRNNQPAILERTVGRGHVVTMTTPVSVGPETSEDNRWNELPTGLEPWPYMMLVDQICSYLAGSTEGQLNYLAGETAVLRLSPGQRYSTYLLTTPRGDTYRQSVNPKQRSIAVATTQWVGNYRVTAGGDEGGLDRGFSVNLPLEASDLARTDDDGLKQVFGDTEFRLAHNRDEIDRHVSTGRVGRELFPLLMALIALVLGAEHVLANRFYRGDAKR